MSYFGTVAPVVLSVVHARRNAVLEAAALVADARARNVLLKPAVLAKIKRAAVKVRRRTGANVALLAALALALASVPGRDGGDGGGEGDESGDAHFGSIGCKYRYTTLR